MADDWRTEVHKTLPYLRGQTFVRKPYKAYRPDWDHDHCAVCGVTIAEPDVAGDDNIHEGYATTSEYERGEDYEWVCAECFLASKEAMDWTDATTA